MPSSTSHAKEHNMEACSDYNQLLAESWRLRTGHRWQQAEALCRKVLDLEPECDQGWHLLGLLHWDQGRFQQAIAHLKTAIRFAPKQALHHNNLGVVLNHVKQFDLASHYLTQALQIQPDYLDAMCNLGLALYYQHHLKEAANLFRRALSIKPKHAVSHANLALVHMAHQDYGEAVAMYHQAVTLDPHQSQWYGNLGSAHHALGAYKEAARCYNMALELAPNTHAFKIRLAVVLRSLGQMQESIALLQSALDHETNAADALVNLVITLEQACQWDELETQYSHLDKLTKDALRAGETPVEDPMLNIRRSSDLALNRAVSQSWSQCLQSSAMQLARPCTHSRQDRKNGRIRLGYLSYDFRDHPVGHLVHPLFQLHDRSRFKVMAFSMGPDDNSTYRKAVQNHSDAFFDLRAFSLTKAVDAIYEQKVDILIDLMGLSSHNRLGILALRPAPVQVGYLGFLSTTGAHFMDYLITDEVVVPEDHQDYYSEHLIRMPDCYQIIPTVGVKCLSREHRKDHGLPEQGVVFCCFNAAYKIDPVLFDTWMSILSQTPQSVLWLFGSNDQSVANMQARAQACGIDPHRLVFAEKRSLPEHLERLSLADIALDTVRYNGGATTANALSVGVPLITVMGNHWVSRMSASHLLSAGLNDLVANNIAGYEQIAIELASDPTRLQSVCQRLSQRSAKFPLFNVSGFVRTLERGYQAIWERYMASKAAKSIQLTRTIDAHTLNATEHCQTLDSIHINSSG